jgi:4-amino-4-deoxy-L-arabinose transferase-like glycosyltransferase
MRSRPALLLLLAALLLAWGWNTWRVGLMEPTEARYAEVAWRMVQSGDWWTPRLNFLEHFHKPAAAYWPPAVVLALLGRHPWAPRLSSLVLGLLLVAGTFFWGRRLLGPREGFWAAVILGSTLELGLQSRLLSADLPLAACVLLAQVSAWHVAFGSGGGKLWPRLFWLALGAGFAVKGPVALLLALVPVLAWKAMGSGEARGSWRWGEGLVLFAAVALPWYLLQVLARPGLLGYFLGYQVLERVATTAHHRPGPPYYYLGVLAGGFLPWSPLLGLAILRDLRRWRRDPLARWFLVGWVPALVVFSLAGSKLPAYVLPLFPLWSLEAARSLREETRFLPLATGLAFVLLGGFGLGYRAWEGHGRILLAAGILFFGGWAILGLAARPLRRRWAGATLVVWALFWAAMVQALPGLGPSFGAVRRLGAVADSLLREHPDWKICGYRTYVRSLPFYTDRPLRLVGVPREHRLQDPARVRELLLPLEADLDSLVRDGARLWVAKRHREEELRRRLNRPLRRILREGIWELYLVSEMPRLSEETSRSSAKTSNASSTSP